MLLRHCYGKLCYQHGRVRSFSGSDRLSCRRCEYPSNHCVVACTRIPAVSATRLSGNIALCESA
jgi:hypothetical protein